ncbi:MAG TPA: protein kinase [Thermoanaerobaculia bacterium]|nr:protein kinase [Thermoanaerobaculia bacterium]
MHSTPAIKRTREIGSYQILEDLGPVPRGAAYLAVDTRSDRPVVLKVIPPAWPSLWQDVASWEILLAETEALGRIYHHGVPSVLEIAEHEGSLLISCAHTEGRTLHELVAEGERPDRETLVDWGSQLLEILAEAHAQGILHRHISENEVIVTPEGLLVLTGFGLTQLVFDPQTAPPPEQAAGELYTTQSDLYAVGSLLRRLAFAGALRCGRGSLGVRDPLLRVLARATFIDPAARYESASEMAEALREAGRRAAGAAPRRGRPAAGSVCRVASFPGGPLRLVEPPAAPSGAASQPRADEEEGALWQALALLVVSLLLMTFVLTTSWILLSRNGTRPASGATARPTPRAGPAPPPVALSR